MEWALVQQYDDWFDQWALEFDPETRWMRVSSSRKPPNAASVSRITFNPRQVRMITQTGDTLGAQLRIADDSRPIDIPSEFIKPILSYAREG